MKIALAADHGGFQLKEIIKKALTEMGHDPVDFGTNSNDAVDWPDVIYPAAMAVAMKECERAILVDGVGYSSAMLANKLPGVYAAVCMDTFSARMSQEHSNANVLCLGGKVLGEALAMEIVKMFLGSKFLGGKYQGRLDKFLAVEKRHLKPLEGCCSGKSAAPMQGSCLTADDVRKALEAGTTIRLAKGSTLTPSAREALRDAGMDPDELLSQS